MVKEIPLTQGQVASVSDEDFEYLDSFNWNASYSKACADYDARRTLVLGYFNGKRKIKTIYMHREVVKRILIEEKNIEAFVDFISNPRQFQVDHVNCSRLDNTRENLRIVNTRQNMQNQKRKTHTSSKYPGVCYYPSRNNWMAYIQIKGKRKHLGYFKNERDAAKAYEKECRRLGYELVCKKPLIDLEAFKQCKKDLKVN